MLKRTFDLTRQLKNVDAIFARVDATYAIEKAKA